MLGNRKGAVSTGGWLAIIFGSILGLLVLSGVVFLATQPRAPVTAAAAFDGEFDDAFLATKGFFHSDYTEQTDCNITSDVLGHNWNSCVYRSTQALNATANAFIDGRDIKLSVVIDVSGTSGPRTEFDVDTGAGTASTGKPGDDLTLTSVKLWTHEDEPTLVADFTNKIENGQDLDSIKLSDVGVMSLNAGEYVLEIVHRTKAISPDFTAADDIARIKIDLDTTEDVDTAQITMESK